jgi:hypothetical protein
MAKSKYESHVKPYLDRIAAWALGGVSQLDIAKNLGICEDSLYEYIKKYPEFAESLKNRVQAVDDIESVLFKTAKGFYFEEESTEYDAKGEVIIKRVYKKLMPPSTTAQIFILKNLRNDKYSNSDKVEVQIAKEQVEVHKELIKEMKSKSALDEALNDDES